jgi:hypothetical protein
MPLAASYNFNPSNSFRHTRRDDRRTRSLAQARASCCRFCSDRIAIYFRVANLATVVRQLPELRRVGLKPHGNKQEPSDVSSASNNRSLRGERNTAQSVSPALTQYGNAPLEDHVIVPIASTSRSKCRARGHYILKTSRVIRDAISRQLSGQANDQLRSVSEGGSDGKQSPDCNSPRSSNISSSVLSCSPKDILDRRKYAIITTILIRSRAWLDSSSHLSIPDRVRLWWSDRICSTVIQYTRRRASWPQTRP